MTRVAVAITGNTLSISGILDFESVPAIDGEGAAWFAAAAPLQCELDLAAVTYSSSVGIALVLGWMRAAQIAGRTLTIKNIPADMLALARVGGLDKLLSGLPPS